LKRNQKNIDAQIQRFGTYILITNEVNLSKEKILDLYKKKEYVEKFFDTMKNDMDRNRLHVQSAERTEGSIFIIFLSLIITSYMDKILRTSKELKNYIHLRKSFST